MEQTNPIGIQSGWEEIAAWYAGWHAGQRGYEPFWSYASHYVIDGHDWRQIDAYAKSLSQKRDEDNEQD